jgi:hypothetical protein
MGGRTVLEQGSDAGSVEWVAQQLIRQHEEGPDPVRATGRCAQCNPEGWCELLSWARTVVLAAGLSHPHG